MSKIFKVELIKRPAEIRKLNKFLLSQPLDYPNHSEWIEKCIHEVKSGYKTSFGCYKNKEIIGDVIVQKDKSDPSKAEIKYLKTDPAFEHIGVGSALLESAEIFSVDNRFKKIVVDTHSTNKKMINFFLKHGFIILEEKALYRAGQLETILIKDVRLD